MQDLCVGDFPQIVALSDTWCANKAKQCKGRRFISLQEHKAPGRFIFRCAERIDNFDPVEISLIVCYDNTAIGLGNGRNNGVQSTSRAASLFLVPLIPPR